MTRYLRVMAETMEQLLCFLQATYPVCDRFAPHTELRAQGIDGDDAVELLGMLDQHFGVSFESFPFQQYFLEEIEISRALAWFGLKRPRVIETELTVQHLWAYMSAHVKSPFDI